MLAAEREVTRLGASVFRSGTISRESMQFVCEVLKRMARVYQKLNVLGVRAVATSAVRDASNQVEFVKRASEAIEAPVEIISGQEEARLIHLGVQTLWPHRNQRVLMIDVGGGSAEIMLSENGRMAEGISRPLGAVRLTEVFLKSDPPSPLELHRLNDFIEEKIAIALKRIGGKPFDRAIATSATAGAVVCAINRIPRARRDMADRLRATTPQVRKLYHALSEETMAERRQFPGIGPRRAEIIVPGAAVFLRIMEAFRLPSIYYSCAGVRDGIIADLGARGVGRDLSRLSREQIRVVEAMSRKFGVSVKHGRKVAALAHTLFEELRPIHRLPMEDGKLLEAAAYLHDTGHYVSDTGHHKHSMYLVQNSDMPAFTDRERALVALLCRYHRKTMPNGSHVDFQALPPDQKRSLEYLAPLLRVADGLDTAREQKVENIECHLADSALNIGVRGTGDLHLELWAAERASEFLRGIYQVSVALVRVRR